MGDRYHWAWGLIDFGNGTFQGAAHGLARLLVNGLLPAEYSHKSILRRINSMFLAADKLRRRDGSMEEAFPYEGSFCVTSLVAFDLLTSLDLLKDYLSEEEINNKLVIIRPMIAYLHRADETHAIISNHLATGAAALIKWSLLTNESGRERGELLLNRIIENQSEEGWYREYQGADPGYQSLATYYLADILSMTENKALRESLHKSIRFLQYFVHPDGSFGGLYGSRNTRFYYPAGIEVLSTRMPEAAKISVRMRSSIEDQTVVTLPVMDEPNFVPMFNSYCWAATVAGDIPDNSDLPCKSDASFRKHWPDAGILIDRGKHHYSIISTKKGGIVYQFKNGKLQFIDPGLLFQNKQGKLFSTQQMISRENVNFEQDKLTVIGTISPITRRLPKPWQFLVLRMLNLTLMRNMVIREWIKRILVKMLITGNQRNWGSNQRSITLGKSLSIKDHPKPVTELTQVPTESVFTSIHMASQGYWQIQDEINIL